MSEPATTTELTDEQREDRLRELYADLEQFDDVISTLSCMMQRVQDEIDELEDQCE